MYRGKCRKLRNQSLCDHMWKLTLQVKCIIKSYILINKYRKFITVLWRSLLYWRKLSWNYSHTLIKIPIYKNVEFFKFYFFLLRKTSISIFYLLPLTTWYIYIHWFSLRSICSTIISCIINDSRRFLNASGCSRN